MRQRAFLRVVELGGFNQVVVVVVRFNFWYLIFTGRSSDGCRCPTSRPAYVLKRPSRWCVSTGQPRTAMSEVVFPRRILFGPIARAFLLLRLSCSLAQPANPFSIERMHRRLK